jgi:hypothetical protein
VSGADEGRVVVERQPDGWWRWRFEPGQSPALVSGEAYSTREEAVESAGLAYPEVRPDVEEPPAEHHRVRTLLRRTMLAVTVVAIVVVAARSGNRRTP